jgi:tetratricopeptide (TPR) repeat protein
MSDDAPHEAPHDAPHEASDDGSDEASDGSDDESDDAFQKASQEAFQKAFQEEVSKVASEADVLANLARLKQAHNDMDHRDVVQATHNAAKWYVCAQRGDRGEPLFKEALAMARRLQDHPSIALSLDYLVALYKTLGRHGEAVQLCVEALWVTERVHGVDSDHPDTARCHANLGVLYLRLEMYGASKASFATALGMRRRLPDDPGMAAYLDTHAGLFYAIGQYDKAELMYAEALALRRAVPGTDVDIAASLTNMARVRKAQGRYRGAEAMYKEALAMLQCILPDDHAMIAQNLDHMGALYDAQGRYAEAEPQYYEALEMRRRLYGEGYMFHPDVLASLNFLALLCQKQLRYEDAERMYIEMLGIYKRTLPSTHADITTCMNNLALMRCMQGHTDEAEPVFRATMKRWEAGGKGAGDGEHMGMAKTLANWASLCFAQRRLVEAGRMYTRALSIMKQHLAADDPDLVGIHQNLAMVHAGQKEEKTSATAAAKVTVAVTQGQIREQAVLFAKLAKEAEPDAPPECTLCARKGVSTHCDGTVLTNGQPNLKWMGWAEKQFRGKEALKRAKASWVKKHAAVAAAAAAAAAAAKAAKKKMKMNTRNGTAEGGANDATIADTDMDEKKEE